MFLQLPRASGGEFGGQFWGKGQMLFLRLFGVANFLHALIRSDITVIRAYEYITSGLLKIQTFRKMRLRQSNHSRIQQNITAPKEYINDAFGGLAPSDTSLACAASCQLNVVPSARLTVNV